MEKFKANDNKNEEHEINYRQFNKRLELLKQILSLISDINQAADEKEVKDCIPALLQYIGEYTDADRVYIFELISEKQDYYSNTFLDDITQSKAAGMNEHFSNPLQMEKVIDTIRFYCTAR